jgi:hypothetical protein
MKIINWDLALNPMNWLTVILMLIIASVAVDILAQFFASRGIGATDNENA